MVTEKTKKVIKDVAFYGAVLIGIYGFTVYNKRTKQLAVEADSARQEAICPALLSISRSARDTLIVMKAETLCNDFVLNNLK